MAIAGRQVQRSPPIPILPLDRCPLRNESLGFCRLSITTGIQKFLADAQSALQDAVSAWSRAASAASYLSFATRSRHGATHHSQLIDFLLGQSWRCGVCPRSLCSTTPTTNPTSTCFISLARKLSVHVVVARAGEWITRTWTR